MSNFQCNFRVFWYSWSKTNTGKSCRGVLTFGFLLTLADWCSAVLQVHGALISQDGGLGTAISWVALKAGSAFLSWL